MWIFGRHGVFSLFTEVLFCTSDITVVKGTKVFSFFFPASTKGNPSEYLLLNFYSFHFTFFEFTSVFEGGEGSCQIIYDKLPVKAYFSALMPYSVFLLPDQSASYM